MNLSSIRLLSNKYFLFQFRGFKTCLTFKGFQAASNEMQIDLELVKKWFVERRD